MKSLVRPALAGLSIVSMFAAITVAGAQKPAAMKAAGYAPVEKIVKPKCATCHQGANPAAGINLSSYAEVMKAKYKGKPIVVAKKPKESALSKSVHGDGMKKMPLGGALSDAEIKTIDAWIASGAKK